MKIILVIERVEQNVRGAVEKKNSVWKEICGHVVAGFYGKQEEVYQLHMVTMCCRYRHNDDLYFFGAEGNINNDLSNRVSRRLVVDSSLVHSRVVVFNVDFVSIHKPYISLIRHQSNSPPKNSRKSAWLLHYVLQYNQEEVLRG